MNKELLFGLATVLTVVTAGHPNSADAASAAVSFKEDVFPILKGRCIECHQPGGEGYEKSGLDLTTYGGVIKGTKYGSMIEPGNPDMSNLMLLLD
jgi:mono/diheme cytochrome c family protein